MLKAIKRQTGEFTNIKKIIMKSIQHASRILTKPGNTGMSSMFALVIVSFVLAFAQQAAAQSTVEKRLYLKTGEELNRVVPTSGSFQSTP